MIATTPNYFSKIFKFELKDLDYRIDNLEQVRPTNIGKLTVDEYALTLPVSELSCIHILYTVSNISNLHPFYYLCYMKESLFDSRLLKSYICFERQKYLRLASTVKVIFPYLNSKLGYDPLFLIAKNLLVENELIADPKIIKFIVAYGSGNYGFHNSTDEFFCLLRNYLINYHLSLTLS